MAELQSLLVADPPELWSDLGFAVLGGACGVSGATIQLGAPGAGVVSWSVTGATGLQELPVTDGELPGSFPSAAHANGVEGLDHVVVATPDLDRTVSAFEAVGVPLRRVRPVGTPDRPLAQAFFKLGAVVVEVVGPPGVVDPGPARFYGLAFTVGDLDATARLLGDRLRPARDAVQPGRRIATLDRGAGSTVAMAFMSRA